MSHEKIELVFSDVETQDFTSGSGKIIKGLATTLDDIVNWFSSFKVDSIELYLKGAVETDGILKLFVSAKGEGGFKVTLKPK